jgi:AraC-like DNA-binding protein
MVDPSSCHPPFDLRERRSDFLPELRNEGRGCWSRGRPEPLERYRSASPFVLVVMAEGAAAWELDGRPYLLRRGDVFCIPTGSLAGGMSRVMDRCDIYWLVFDIAGLQQRSAQAAAAFQLIVDARRDVFAADPDICQLVRRFHQRLRQACVQDELELSGILAQVLALAARAASARTTAPAGAGPDLSAELRARLRHDPLAIAGVQGLAETLGVSRSSLHQVIKRETGLSPSALLLQLRVELATERLAAGESLAAVRTACGFGSSKQFARCFRQVQGVNPSQWLRKQALPIEVAGPGR